MADVYNWQLGRTIPYPYPEAHPQKQFAAVFNIVDAQVARAGKDRSVGTVVEIALADLGIFHKAENTAKVRANTAIGDKFAGG